MTLTQWVSGMFERLSPRLTVHPDPERVRRAAERLQHASNTVSGQLREIERDYPDALKELLARLTARRPNQGQ